MVTLPIIIAERGGVDVSIYDSLEQAIFQIEPIDVQHDEYEVFDADGREIRLKTEGNQISVDCISEIHNRGGDLKQSYKPILKQWAVTKRTDAK